MSSDQWERPPADLVLLSGDIHVWRASLDQPASHVQRLSRTLSADERLRAERFYFERDRLRFIVGRGLLRTILGRYLGAEPGQLHFCYSAHGKPSLEPKGFHDPLPRGGADQNPLGLELRFNLAHSHGLALYAVTRAQELGVDIEYIRPVVEVEQIIKRFFSAGEIAVLEGLPPDQKIPAFFNCWTRKEAYIKAIGDGLSRPLDQFEVSLAPGEPAGLLSVAGDSREASRWFIQALIPASGYVAAVVVEGRGGQFKYWDLGVEGQCDLERNGVELLRGQTQAIHRTVMSEASTLR